jgi:isopentenyl-diphosphate delta-isomerase
MSAGNDDDLVVLVDDRDAETGTAGKLDAHRRGLKHRAISALVKNAAGEFLLQQRALSKYHSGGLWTNACCSHPLPGEATLDAAHRRLKQEMGIDCALSPMFTVHYRADVSGGLIENELVHVFGGRHDGAVEPDPGEAAGHRWMTLPALEADMRARPEAYTVWFRKYMAEHRGAIAAWLAE